MVEYRSVALDRVFGALADPTRRAIVARLARRPATLSEIAEPFAMSLNVVSKHLRVLERAGLVRRQVVGREHRCALNPAALPPDRKDTLIVYSFMFGLKMARACSSCTSILDALDGEAAHVQQRVKLAVVAKSPIKRIHQFARERGWRHLRLLSSERNTYNRVYHGENEAGDQLPALNVFVRRSGRIHHFYTTELLYAPSDPGQNAPR